MMRLGAMCMWFLAAGVAHADGPEYVTFAQGVIVRLGARPAVLAMNDKQGIDAWDPQSGKRLWHSDAAEVPILVRGDLLLAVGKGKLLLLDVKTGKARGALADVPSGYGVGEGMGSASQILGVSVGGKDYLSCNARTWYVGGAAPPGGRMPPGTNNSASYEVDLSARKLTETKDALPAPSVQATSYTTAGVEYAPFDVAGTQVQVTTETPASGAPRVLLRRTRSGKAQPEVVLVDPFSMLFHPLVAADLRHVNVAEQIDGAGGAIQYRSVVYDSASGAKDGGFTAENIPVAFVVLGSRMVYFWPDLVNGVDLKSGKVMYSHAVRDLKYKGPYPP